MAATGTRTSSSAWNPTPRRISVWSRIALPTPHLAIWRPRPRRPAGMLQHSPYARSRTDGSGASASAPRAWARASQVILIPDPIRFSLRRPDRRADGRLNRRASGLRRSGRLCHRCEVSGPRQAPRDPSRLALRAPFRLSAVLHRDVLLGSPLEFAAGSDPLLLPGHRPAGVNLWLGPLRDLPRRRLTIGLG